MGLVSEFKAFAIKGNVLDLAVGVVIGAAFGKIVSSLVDNIIMPPIGLLLGDLPFRDLHLVLKHGIGENPSVTINYGLFLQSVIDFLIIAWAIFMMLRLLNSFKKKQTEKPAELTKQEELLTEIRNLLQQRQA